MIDSAGSVVVFRNKDKPLLEVKEIEKKQELDDYSKMPTAISFPSKNKILGIFTENQ